MSFKNYLEGLCLQDTNCLLNFVMSQNGYQERTQKSLNVFNIGPPDPSCHTLIVFSGRLHRAVQNCSDPCTITVNALIHTHICVYCSRVSVPHCYSLIVLISLHHTTLKLANSLPSPSSSSITTMSSYHPTILPYSPLPRQPSSHMSPPLS